jgi:tetratricopeptide (TPR) repeat protein
MRKKTFISIAIIALMAIIGVSMIVTYRKSGDFRAGMQAYENGRFAEAVEHYSRALENRYATASVYNNRGLAYLAAGDYDKAVEDFSKAIELDPEQASFYVNRGKAYFKKGSSYDKGTREQVADDFSKAIELVPDFVDAYYNRALVRIEDVHYHHKYETIPPKLPSADMDSYNKALTDLDRVLSLNPGHALAYTARGNLFYRHGDWDLSEKEHDRALSQWDKILELSGEEGLGGAFNSRARNRLAAGDLKGAISDFTEAIEHYRKGVTDEGQGLCRSVTNALAHRTIAAWEMGAWEDTIAYARETIRVKESNPKKYGTSAYYYFTLGRCYYKLGRHDEAVENLLKGMEERSFADQGRYWLGLTYKAMGENEKAGDELRKALAAFDKQVNKDPDNKRYKAHLRRGLCYTELGEYEKALADFEETIRWKVFSDKPVNHTNYYLDAHTAIGHACLRAGDKDAARRHFEKAVELARERGFDEVVTEIRSTIEAL